MEKIMHLTDIEIAANEYLSSLELKNYTGAYIIKYNGKQIKKSNGKVVGKELETRK